MKKIIYSTLLLFLFSIPSMLKAQNLNEIVMQKCLNLNELEKVNLNSVSNTQLDKVYILDMQLPEFSSSNILSFGKEAVFVKRDIICDQSIKDYYVFQTFLVTETTAKIVFHHYYIENGEDIILEINPIFQKKGEEWIVTETNLLNK